MGEFSYHQSGMDTVIFILTAIIMVCMGCLCGAYYYFADATERVAQAKKLRKRIRKTLRGIIEAFGENGQNGFVRAIQAANPDRKFETMGRRIIKIGEEYGETAEAYLVSTTTKPTRKVKTYRDVREEAIDTAIVAVDVALTRFPGEEEMTDEEIEAEVMAHLATKLQKWRDQSKRASATQMVDDV